MHGVAVAVMGSAIFLALFQFTSKLGLLCNIIFMLLAGACNCGPDPYLSGSIAAELGDKENAQAAVSGMINGTFIIIPFSYPGIHHLGLVNKQKCHINNNNNKYNNNNNKQ